MRLAAIEDRHLMSAAERILNLEGAGKTSPAKNQNAQGLSRIACGARLQFRGAGHQAQANTSARQG